MSDEDVRSQADLEAELRVEGHNPADYFNYSPDPWVADGEVGSTGAPVRGTEADYQYDEITSRPDADDVHFSEYEQRSYEYDPSSGDYLLESEHPETGELESATYSVETGNVTSRTPDHDPPDMDDWETGRIGVIAREDYHVYDVHERNIERYWDWVSNMGSEATNEHSTYWRRVSTLLQATSETLRARGDALALAWQGEAANEFLLHIGGTLYSLDEWDRIASGNAYSLAQIASTIERAQSDLGRLYGNYWATVHLLENWWPETDLSRNHYLDGMPIYNPQSPEWDPGTGVTIDASNIIPPLDDPEEVNSLVGSADGGQITGTVVLVNYPEDVQRLYHNRAANIVQELADTFNYENFNGFPEGRRFDGPAALNPTPGAPPPDTSGLDDFMNQLGNVGIPAGAMPDPGAIDMPLLGPTNLPTVPLIDGPVPGLGTGPGGFLAGVPLPPGLNPSQLTSSLTAQQQALTAQQQALANQQATLQQQLSNLTAQQQAQAALNAALATRAAAAMGGAGLPGAAGARVNLPGGITAPSGVAAPGATLRGVTGVGPLGQPNLAGVNPLEQPSLTVDGVPVSAQGTAALPGTTGPGGVTGPGAGTGTGFAGTPGAAGMAGMMPPPPPPIVPPMMGRQRGREGAQPGAGPLAGTAAGMPGAPPPMFIPPGRTTPRGLTPTSPKPVRPALAGTTGRPGGRPTGLRGVHGTTPAPQSRPESRPAAPERVPVPGAADQELWMVKKPKGVLQGSEPPRPTPHGKPIGAAG